MAPPNSGHRRARPDPSPDWRLRAACRSHPHPGVDHAKERVDQVFSSPEGERGPRQLTATEAAAIRVCFDLCNVRHACRDYALEAMEASGIWGGLRASDLAAIRKRRRWGTRSGEEAS